MANKKIELDLSMFQATSNAIRVCIPKDCFSIHPDIERQLPNVYLSHTNDKWWLIAADVIEQEGVRIPKLWRANLFEGMTQEGQRFILPITFLLNGGQTSWSESWEAIIAKARHRWIKVKADKEQECFDITQQRKHQASGIDWPDDDFADLIHQAFRGRMITSSDAAIAKLQRTSCREAIEEMDD